MHTQETHLDGLTVTITAHEESGRRVLLIAAAAAPEPETTSPERPPARVAVVIDRSGSMAGEKLQIAQSATARLIRSLHPRDRIGVAVYDDDVRILGEIGSPSEALASHVEHLRAGNCTNLYEGWKAGVDLLGSRGEGGRVLLLSDGLANRGRYTRADDLAREAGGALERRRVVTSTIGIGSDYDEGLMSAMARAGSGGHYFAASADSIMDSFAQERFALRSIAFSGLQIRVGSVTRSLGQLWYGELKRLALPVDTLTGVSASLHYATADGSEHDVPLRLPDSWTVVHEATLELLLEEAAELEDQAAGVRDSQAAMRLADAVRRLLLRLYAHPLANGDVARTVAGRLKASHERLEQLARDFDEREAMLHRKRSYQSSYNLRERGKAFSAFEDERETVMEYACAMSMPLPDDDTLEVNVAAFSMVAPDRWRAWGALPVSSRQGRLEVALVRPRDGFVIAEIEAELKTRVRPRPRPLSEDKLAEALAGARVG